MVFSKKSLTNFNPFKSIFKSLTTIFLSIRKFGIIFFSLDDNDKEDKDGDLDRDLDFFIDLF